MGLLDNVNWGDAAQAVTPWFLKKEFVQGLKPFAEKTLDSAVSGATYPGDVYSGKEAPPIPSQNPDLSRAADTFGLLPAGSTVGMAAGMIPKNTAGVFGGRLSATADRHALDRAEKWAKWGEKPRDIWNETGWFQGKDGKWRYEIPDKPAKVDTDYLSKNIFYEGKLGGLLDHPELFKAYPELKKANVKARTAGMTFDDMSGSWWSPDPKFIRKSEIEAFGPKTGILRPLMHEIQHGIQGAEGFHAGEPSLNPIINPHRFRDYARQPIEREARAVEGRIKMTPAQLKKLFPLDTPDYLKGRF